VGVKYTVSPDVLVFANYSTGYRGSSVNGQAFYSAAEVTVAKPETLSAVDLGVKSEWLDHRLRLNATAFWYDYRNQQFLDVTPYNLQVLTNAPKATLYGIETELTARITSDLTWNLGAGYTHSRYDQLTLRGRDLAGNQLIGTPKWTANSSLDWVFLRRSGVDLNLHADTVYTSRRYFDAFQQEAVSQAGYWVVNGRVSARINDGAYVVSIWAKNIADERYSPFKIDLRGGFNFIYAHRAPPRTLGVELSHRF
jgi:iron complex outermembrane receptor protein